MCVGKIDGGHIGGGRSGSESARVTSHSNASHQLAEGTATVLAWRPRHTLRDVHRNLIGGRRQTGLAVNATLPPSTVWEDPGTHTHCLTPILSTVTRENGNPSCGQQWLTIAVHKWSLSLEKTLGFRTCVEALLKSFLEVCCFAHSNDTETIPTPVY